MVSVLLATRNPNKEYFKEAVLSVLNQTYKDIELLIGFNDCDIQIPKIEDKRIRIFRFDEKGKSKTLNKLLELSKGEHIAIQDDDDIWVLDKLEIQLKEKHKVIGSKILYINELGKITGQPNLEITHHKIVEKSYKGINQMANTSVIFKRSDAIEVGGWSDLDGIEDYDFWLKLMKKGCSFVNVDLPLVYHRIHSESNFNTKKHDIKGLLKSYGL